MRVSSTSSGMPPTEVATTGTPAAIASSTDIGMPSDSLDSTNTSASASSAPTSLRSPSSSTAPPSRAAAAASAGRSGPSPATRRRNVPGSSRATASSSVVKSLGARSRPTLSSVTGPATVAAARHPRGWHAVVDDDRAVAPAGACPQPGLQLGSRDADRGRGQRAHQAVGPQVRLRRAAGARLERPAVHREQPHGDPGDDCGEAAEHARLGAVGVHDRGPLAPEQPDELDQPARVLDRVQRAAHMVERHVARAGAASGVGQESLPVGGDRDVVLGQQRGEQRRDVRLRPAGLRQRDHHQDPRPAHAGSRPSALRSSTGSVTEQDP